MRLTVIGCGNIGTATALSFASKGHSVCAVDRDKVKIESLQNGFLQFYEPSLQETLTQYRHNLSFTDSLVKGISHADIIFICIDVLNSRTSKLPDTENLMTLAQDISLLTKRETTVILKSTLPPGTTRTLAEKFKKLRFIFSPEFLREGSALEDCLHPERIVIGSADPNSLKLVKNIYADLGIDDARFLFMSYESAEISKYAANTFLAARISLINEFSQLCDSAKADIKDVQKVLASDSRIGREFLNAGIGYGGSCFPKDTDAIATYGKLTGLEIPMIQAIQLTNASQLRYFLQKIQPLFSRLYSVKRIAIWGASFKPNTDDLREAPAIKIIQELMQEDCVLYVYDPESSVKLKKLWTDKVNVAICDTAADSIQDANALIICTEWDEFVNYDLKKLKSLMKNPVIFDGRNIYDPKKMKELGFEYHSVGRPS